MKININIELDGSNRDVQILNAITKAIRNTPPEGFTSIDGGVMPEKPTEVFIHATEDDLEAAKEAIVTAPNVKVKAEEPLPTETRETAPPELTGDAANNAAKVAKETGQRLRELLLAVSKLEGNTIQTAKTIASEAAGIPFDKDFPSNPKAQLAIKALEAAL